MICDGGRGGSGFGVEEVEFELVQVQAAPDQALVEAQFMESRGGLRGNGGEPNGASADGVFDEPVELAGGAGRVGKNQAGDVEGAGPRGRERVVGFAG